MFTKVLIANRGAITTRILRTLKSMGITSVVVYSEADADSLHVQLADESYSLGEGAAANTYLDQDKIFAIAKESGAQAIHPGYGFLSENPDFTQRCHEEGFCFIGPTPQQMLTFGLKHTARDLAQDAQVPLLPGTDLLRDVEHALESAQKIGYPVMLKSTAGGGGIGMQLCYSHDELDQAFDSVKRLSANNFSNDGVFLEKFVERARHIEVQIFGDGKGNAIALGERDCSAQRRNQKVVEETPAPNLPENVRQQLHSTAVRLVELVNYQNAGTVEFVYDQGADEFYFLEVNTRLQVEHGVTEMVFGVDLVSWMVQLAAGELPALSDLQKNLKPKGHAVQMRLYAEDANKSFQPSAGLLTQVSFPECDNDTLRIDRWIEAGVEVSPFFDPMLAKIICHSDSREEAINALDSVLSQSQIHGIETNKDYVQQILKEDIFTSGTIFTRFLNEFNYQPCSIDVLTGGTMSTIQDVPGREGHWHVGVPPSGPFDDYSFRLGNRLLNNDKSCAGLELTLNGPTLRFNSDTQIVLTGALMQAELDGVEIDFWKPINIRNGQTLKLGKVTTSGSRSYLLVKGGLQCPDYLGSKSTFTLGQFGGHGGRALRSGDVLKLDVNAVLGEVNVLPDTLVEKLKPEIENAWELPVIYGPHGSPDFFTDEDIATFFDAQWEVHYNSSRTGVRLVGPKPQWARTDGGEAGMHPSNIHDNAYAFGTVDFTGDMPVILGPDGPSLGGFVCPATVINCARWKLGQLKAGDKVRFIPVSLETSEMLEIEQQAQIDSLKAAEKKTLQYFLPDTPVIKRINHEPGNTQVEVCYRPAGDKFILVEYGDLVLDIEIRFRVHALMLWLQDQNIEGLKELTPGIRSLQLHYDNHVLPRKKLLDILVSAEQKLGDGKDLEVPARVVHLPLSWDDEACRLAIEKYMQSVRSDAPWCPSNIEFIRRMNGLESIEDVRKVVFDASYLVMGLGDVYLGAPVATPLDPRHRLVTTKYNPARTWTAENSVGIGGAYMCVYGMEGPGGYQFVGRTSQMWNRYKNTEAFENPWLLRFFDQIKFYPVSSEELVEIRKEVPRGNYKIKIEETSFKLNDYQDFLTEHKTSIDEFTQRRDVAFDEELQRWVESGQINFEAQQDLASDDDELTLPENGMAIESHIAGNVWQVLVKEGDEVKEGQAVMVIESMKMEIEVQASEAGKVHQVIKPVGSQVAAGQSLMSVVC